MNRSRPRRGGPTRAGRGLVFAVVASALAGSAAVSTAARGERGVPVGVAWASRGTPPSPAAAAPAEGKATQVDWYRLALDGRSCGHMRRESTARPDGGRRTVEETEMVVARDGVEARIGVRLETVESSTGTLLEASRRFEGDWSSETRWIFARDRVEEIRIESGARVRRELELPRDREFLAPSAAQSFFAARRAAGADTVRWTTVSFEQGFEIVEVRATRLGEAAVRWDGRAVTVSRWRMESSGNPLSIEEWWSRDDRLVESRVSTGIGVLVARLATAADAAAWRDRAQGGLPDVIAASVVPLAGRLPVRGDIELEVSTRDLEELPRVPDTAGQRFERIAGDAEGGRAMGRLILRRGGTPFECENGPTPGPEHLAAGPLIEIDDDLVRTLALKESGVDPGAAPAVRAEGLRRFVRRWIRRKDLATALAGAAEVARSRSGDCTEHATLLAAMLRVHDIPARIAVGLVHADRFAGRRNVFAWHAWVQGWIDGRWVDLDATAAGAENGVRIAMAFSGLAGGVFDPVWIEVLPMMGAIELEVIPTSIPDAAP